MLLRELLAPRKHGRAGLSHVEAADGVGRAAGLEAGREHIGQLRQEGHQEEGVHLALCPLGELPAPEPHRAPHQLVDRLARRVPG